MAFDGIVVASLASELKHKLLNGRISKIAQPEADELLLTPQAHRDSSGRNAQDGSRAARMGNH